MHYNKLVRDKIPDVIRGKGGNPITHTADEAEYWIKLKEKLSEEISEFLKDENIEEMADIMEVMEAIILYKNFDPAEIEEVKESKAQERGRFNDRIILDES